MSEPNSIVRGFVSTSHGDGWDLSPQVKSAGDKEVYEVNISQQVRDPDGEKSYVNVRISVWGRAIEPVKAVVDKILAAPQDKRPQVAFEGEWQDPYTRNGRTTLQFRAFDVSPFFSAYARKAA